MEHGYCVAAAAVGGVLVGLLAGFIAGIWKAAKMQVLREAQQARQGDSSHIEPTKPWPRK